MENAIELAKQGNERAISYLYKKHYKVINNIILNIVKDYDIANDLTSEVFIKAFKNLKKYYVDISFEMWLKTIANNTSIDFIRKIKRYSIDSIDNDDSIFKLAYTDNITPEDKIIYEEESKILRSAIDKLPYLYGSLIKMRIYKGFSYKEIARHANISIGCVKSYLYKAKKLLIKIINEKLNQI